MRREILPSQRGARSADSVVNECPVGVQSRADRVCRRDSAAVEAADEGNRIANCLSKPHQSRIVRQLPRTGKAKGDYELSS